MSNNNRHSITLYGKEEFWGSGMEHPDVTTALSRDSHGDEGSRPIPAGDLTLNGKGVGPANGVIGNAVQRLTKYFGGKLIEMFGDYWLSTQFGSVLTDGRKVRVKKIITDAGVIDGYQVKPHDHFLKIDAHDHGAVPVTVYLPSLEGGPAGAVGVPAQIESYTARGLVADDQIDRQFWGRELFIEAFNLNGGQVEIRQSVDLTQAGYTWTRSTFDQDEWYLTLDNGATTGLAVPASHNAMMDQVQQGWGAGGPGTLVAGQFGYGNVDALGFNTFYIHIGAAGVNPNLREIIAGYGMVLVLDEVGENVHLVSFWDQTAADADWNIICTCRPHGVPLTTVGPTTIAPTTLITTDAPTTPDLTTLAPTTLAPTTLATTGG